MKDEIKVSATMDNLDTVIGFLEEKLEGMGCPMKISMKIAVSVEELYVNVVNYAYDDSEGDFSIGIEEIGSEELGVRITLTDKGKKFNPLLKEDPDTTLDAEERKIGGLGIFMAKNIMDTINYDRKDENNIIIMEKSW